MKDKLLLGVLGVISTIIGIIIGVHTLSAQFVSNDVYEERKEHVEGEFQAIEKSLDEIKSEQKDFRKETNEKLNTLLMKP